MPLVPAWDLTRVVVDHTPRCLDLGWGLWLPGLGFVYTCCLVGSSLDALVGSLSCCVLNGVVL